MKIIVNPHKLEIEKSPVNEKEINITKCEFEFNDIPEEYVKDAYFTLNGTSYKVLIANNECSIPYEVLTNKGQIEIGVVAFLVENEEEIKRYNPSPVYINTLAGSLKDAKNVEPITPTDKEQMEQAIQDMETKIDNLDIDAEKVDKTTTVTITKKDGSTKEVEILDGEDGTSLESIEIKNRDLYVTYGGSESDLGQVAPNIQIGTTTTGNPSTPASVINVGTDLNPILNFVIPKGEAGAIKMIIVNELPETGVDDTIYLVPVEDPETGNNYEEYIYVNNNWEKLGGIQVEVDLTDYVKNTDYASSSKGGVIKVFNDYATDIYAGRLYAQSKNYEQYQGLNTNMFISKGTLENVITGKGLVSNTDYASSSTGGVVKTNAGYGVGMYLGEIHALTKTYEQYTSGTNSMFISKGTLENVLTARIGAIDEVIDNINGEVI